VGLPDFTPHYAPDDCLCFFPKEQRISSGHGCAEKRKEGWKGLSGNRINKSDWSDWSIGCFCAEPFNTNDINCYSAVKASPYGTQLPSCCDHKRDSDPRPESDAAAYYSPCTQTQKRRGMHWKNAGTAQKALPDSRSWRRRETIRERVRSKIELHSSVTKKWQTLCPDRNKKKATRKPAYLNRYLYQFSSGFWTHVPCIVLWQTDDCDNDEHRPDVIDIR